MTENSLIFHGKISMVSGYDFPLNQPNEGWWLLLADLHDMICRDLL